MSQIFYYPERWDVTPSQEEARNLLLLSSHVFSSFFVFFLSFIYLFIIRACVLRGTSLSLFTVTSYKCKSGAGLWFIYRPNKMFSASCLWGISVGFSHFHAATWMIFLSHKLRLSSRMLNIFRRHVHIFSCGGPEPSGSLVNCIRSSRRAGIPWRGGGFPLISQHNPAVMKRRDLSFGCLLPSASSGVKLSPDL